MGNIPNRETNAQARSKRRVDGTEKPSCSDQEDERDLSDDVIPVLRRTKDDA